MIRTITMTALAVGISIMMPVTASAQPDATDKDKIVVPELIADTTAVKPGQSFTVGVHYKLLPSWHIYAQNPGGSGMPTTVKWGAPTGSGMSETLYPAPTPFTGEGDLTVYGYADEAMLMMEVKAPANLAGDSFEVTANTRYLMCSTRCLSPTTKNLKLTLPVGEGKPANADLFAKYKKLLPKKASELPKEAVLKSTVSGSTTEFEMTITPPAGKALVADGHYGLAAFFFPDETKDFVTDQPVVTGATKGAGASKVYTGPVTLKWKAEPQSANATGPVKSVSGVLTFQPVSADGATKDAPVIVSVENLPVK